MKRTRRLCVLCFLCALCGVGVSASAAVADYVGKPIASVRITIEGRDTADLALTQVVETTAGQPLSMVAVRETVTHLFSLGRFEGVSADATLENGAVALHYVLSPIHPVTHIQFSGTPPGIDEHTLRRAMTDRYGATPSLGRAADMSRIAEALLTERGYFHATVTPSSRLEHDPERASVLFTIDAKARTTIGDVEIVGRSNVSRSDFLSRLGLTPGSPYQRDRLASAIERYVADRRNSGYYQARIVPIVTLADGDRIANVKITVSPGPRVRVVFAGDPLPADRRDELVPIAREGSVDEDLLEDSSHRIEEFFRAQGYRTATAPHTREETESELVITFTVAKGPLYRVSSYEVSGNENISADEINGVLKVRVDQPFSDARLDADVSAIEALYRRRGFAAVRAPTAIDAKPPAGNASEVPVAVRMTIIEGVRTTVDAVAFAGNTSMDEAVLRARITLQPGAPYVPGQLASDGDAVQALYQDAGYENVTVDAAPQYSADQSRATITFRIQEGPRIFVDHVLIVGNVRTRTETIERELQVKSGDPFSLAAINESQRRLTALGLFRRARINELRHGSDTTRDLLVTIEEAPPTTIGYGAGVEGRRRVIRGSSGNATERFDLAPRALLEIGRRNLFGSNRSANLFMSLSRSVTNPLTEYRIVGTFREPRLFNTSADAFINGTLEQQHRSIFDFARRSFSGNLEKRFSGPYRMTGTYQLQRTALFNKQDFSNEEQQIIFRTFPEILLSSFSGSFIRDTRDDPLDTHDGQYTSASAQLAAQAIGSEVGFFKSFVTGQIFRTLPGQRRVVFAGDARVGLATGFRSEGAPEGDLPPSERFFAGGDTTVRGFELDQLGIAGQTLDPTGFGIGGSGLVIFNAELRLPVSRGLGVVGFVDTGNVFRRASDVDLGALRTALGGGIRYKSPVGPLRFDVGFKVNRQPGESRSAWFVSFGQAF